MMILITIFYNHISHEFRDKDKKSNLDNNSSNFGNPVKILII